MGALSIAKVAVSVHIKFDEPQDLPNGPYINQLNQTTFEVHTHAAATMKDVYQLLKVYGKSRVGTSSIKWSISFDYTNFKGGRLQEDAPLGQIGVKTGDILEVHNTQKFATCLCVLCVDD